VVEQLQGRRSERLIGRYFKQRSVVTERAFDWTLLRRRSPLREGIALTPAQDTEAISGVDGARTVRRARGVKLRAR
jgi:hypothetical protein